MIYPRIAFTIAATIAVAACSPSGNPHLDMCKKITSNILASNVEFGEISEREGNKEMRMTLPYTSDGTSSEALCVFASENSANKDNDSGSYTTSPREVTIDGVKIGTKELMRATLASSTAVIKDSAEETTRRAAAAAEDAKDKATELAGEAKDKASEVATQIKDSEAVARAKELADETTDKAKAALIEGAKTIQEKLEN